MIREHDNRAQDMDDGDLRTGMRRAVAEVVAPLDLYEQVAGSARRRQRARVQVGAGAVVLALGAAVGVGIGDPFEWRGGDQADTATPDLGGPTRGVPNLPAPVTGAPAPGEEPPGTALTTCPTSQPEASNPGVTQGPMLPDHPGKVLVCEYPLPAPGSQPSGVTLSPSAAEHFARMVNSLPQSPNWDGGVCLLGAPGQAVFFRNAAGNEAVLRVGGSCFNALTDGRVQVPWDGRTPMVRFLPT
ncbi:hypothetical protein [Yinghuangia sp. YIM S09857]|uniref:hypothetical protein n=1 Tax=Yinghuangia sp. YIM S09857 TaxID=3436929 RepID=UPI003F535432